MAKAIRLSERGGPQVLKWEEVELGVPGAGEVLLRQTAVGVHIGQRYPLAQAARAQRDLEARRTIGSTVLIP